MGDHDRLVTTVVGAQDIEFFEEHPDRVYRVRPAHPLEIDEFRCQYVVDETRFQPAVVVKQSRSNGYQFMARMLVGAPKGIDLFKVGDALARRIFERTCPLPTRATH